MKVAMYDVDSKKIPNLALMKLTRFHHACGDTVEAFDPSSIGAYDKIYASKIFDFSSAPFLDPSRMEIGGSGYDMGRKLPPYVEPLQPDYSLYPDFPHNIGFAMRGCRRRCRFCKVPVMEGAPLSVSGVKEILVQDSDFLILLDNDFFGNPDWESVVDEIVDLELTVNLSQGINIRSLSEHQASRLAEIKFANLRNTAKQVTFAWDSIQDERLIKRGIERCKAAGIRPYRLQAYVLIGFDSTPAEDLYRVQTLLAEKVDPYAMPYDRTSRYQRAFARWVNGRICRSVPWPEYRTGNWKGAQEEGLLL